MKKHMHIAHVLAIALWPVVFLVVTQQITISTETVRRLTFDHRSMYWLSLAYVISGIIFAILTFSKKDYKRKSMLFAHIASIFLLFLMCIPEIAMYLFDAPELFLRTRRWYQGGYFTILPLFFTYTLCAAIRAFVLYRKKEQATINNNNDHTT
ncbi:MAG: hypothetical protein FWD25_00090 [Clostridia bacterium]|nr:hypothetical protein [Clostridia bacterium]